MKCSLGLQSHWPCRMHGQTPSQKDRREYLTWPNEIQPSSKPSKDQRIGQNGAYSVVVVVGIGAESYKYVCIKAGYFHTLNASLDLLG